MIKRPTPLQTPPAEVRPAAAHIADAILLLALLEQERRALHTADHERLAGVCREKAQLLKGLSGLLNVLRQPLSISLPPAQRQQLHELLLRCQQENRLNDALLEACTGRMRRKMQALRGMPADYDGCGRSVYRVSGSLRGAA